MKPTAVQTIAFYKPFSQLSAGRERPPTPHPGHGKPTAAAQRDPAPRSDRTVPSPASGVAESGGSAATVGDSPFFPTPISGPGKKRRCPEERSSWRGSCQSAAPHFKRGLLGEKRKGETPAGRLPLGVTAIPPLPRSFSRVGRRTHPPPRFVAGCVCVCVEKQTEPRSMAFGSPPPASKAPPSPAHPGPRPQRPPMPAERRPPPGSPAGPRPPARSLLPRRPGPGSPQPAIPYIAAAAAINSPAPPAGAGPGAAGGGFSAAGTRHHPRLGDGHVFLTFDSFLCRGAAARLPVLVGGGGTRSRRPPARQWARPPPPQPPQPPPPR